MVLAAKWRLVKRTQLERRKPVRKPLQLSWLKPDEVLFRKVTTVTKRWKDLRNPYGQINEPWRMMWK